MQKRKKIENKNDDVQLLCCYCSKWLLSLYNTHTHTNLHNQKEKMIGTRCYDDDDDD